MKKIVTSMIVMSVLSVSLYGYSTEERIEDMKMMEMAMAKIQKGLLSNIKSTNCLLATYIFL